MRLAVKEPLRRQSQRGGAFTPNAGQKRRAGAAAACVGLRVSDPASSPAWREGAPEADQLAPRATDTALPTGARTKVKPPNHL